MGCISDVSELFLEIEIYSIPAQLITAEDNIKW
jgi:hypothetical protein